MRCLLNLLVLVVLGGITAASIVVGTKPEEELTPPERWWSDGGAEQVLGGLVALTVVGLVGWAVRRHRQERRAWDEFAGRHGLSPPEEGRTDALEGSLDGRRVTLRRVRIEGIRLSGQQREPSVTQQVLTLAVPGVPAGLSVSRPLFGGDALSRLSEGLVAGLRQMTGAPDQRLATGDAEFDALVQVSCPDAEAARAWLTPGRREVLRELLGEPGYSLGPEGLLFSRTDCSRSEVELTEALYRLQELARRLERG